MSITIPSSAVIVPSEKPIALADIIGYVETKNDSHGYRFEPALYAAVAGAPSKAASNIIATIQQIHKCSLATAKCIFSCSFGATQILAENLYDPAIGLKVSVFDYQNDPVLQAAIFHDYVTWKHIDYSVDSLKDATLREHFALVYNGALAYASLIEQSLQHFGVL
jgi:hypothetical protein